MRLPLRNDSLTTPPYPLARFGTPLVAPILAPPQRKVVTQWHHGGTNVKES